MKKVTTLILEKTTLINPERSKMIEIILAKLKLSDAIIANSLLVNDNKFLTI